ncbi:integral membrane protein [Blastomyces gilchristii SLH14081]|uniref:Integral membrane protein n=1 Tax=Blastomyces gilchristii (strain SLH14081) TaxID=559298 RepID=A0A179UWY9_BLAGS|nr:uncharacterized protein BDBG_07024 [Blastomyces gilchristii SLH14081]OAT11571.1 integral membrane protein [Blastomyces gilchristii SLH14081]
MEGLPPPSKAPPFPIVTADQRSVLGVATAYSIIPTLEVSLRILARNVARRSLEAIDYCIIAALALESVSITGVIQGGIGCGHTIQVIQESGPEPAIKLLKLLIPLQFLWVLSLSFCKVSILLLYSRIGRGAMVFIAAWAIATIIAGCTICRLFAYNWDQSIPGGECGDQVLSFTITEPTSSVPSAYTPSPPWISKTSPSQFPQQNIFSGLEPSVAVTLSCIPLLRPLLNRSKYGSDGTPGYPAIKHHRRVEKQRTQRWPWLRAVE